MSMQFRIEKRQDMRVLTIDADGAPLLRRQLTDQDFARLVRAVVDRKDEAKGPFDPPFVVVVESQYDTDGDQQTPSRHDAWVFSTIEAASAARAALDAEIEAMDSMARWRFDVRLPAVPENDVIVGHCGAADPPLEDVLQDFRVVVHHYFDGEVGSEYWNRLTAEALAEIEALDETSDLY